MEALWRAFNGKLDAFKWLKNALHPFNVFFIALFLVTIGFRLNLVYLKGHLLTVGLGKAAIYSKELLADLLIAALMFAITISGIAG